MLNEYKCCCIIHIVTDVIMVFNTYLNRDKQVEGSQSNESTSNEHGSRREPPYGYGAMKLGEEIGAKVKIGKRVLWDKVKVDQYLNNLTGV